MNLYNFIVESNRIEGILRAPTYEEITAHDLLLAAPTLTVPAIKQFVWLTAKAEIRDRFGMNVRVGDHLPLPGGPGIPEMLAELLMFVVCDKVDPYRGHVAYETLHPFMDGNGRSGRAIWVWHMHRLGRDPFSLGFLHHFYYQALSAST